MRLIWKLLRQHISVPQFAGFALANLFGLLIVLLGYQLYRDVAPVFTSDDSFLHADYLIVNKKIGTGETFSDAAIRDIEGQPFVKGVGRFTASEYSVNATMSVGGIRLFSSEIFFESVPDQYVDVSQAEWHYERGEQTVPVILPRAYFTMYNFGFAQRKSLPKVGDNVASIIDIQLSLHGNGQTGHFRGKVIGFSSRMNTILVPEEFIKWTNETYAPEEHSQPTRLVVEVGNPADERITTFLDEKDYEVDADKLNAERATAFLRIVVTIVLAIGMVISLLSFYILMLSIYLLVEKNSEKLKNLRLLGYSSARIALPYQLLTIALSALVLMVSLALLAFVRGYYMGILLALFPQMEEVTMLPVIALGIALMLVVSVVNALIIYNKVRHCE